MTARISTASWHCANCCQPRSEPLAMTRSSVSPPLGGVITIGGAKISALSGAESLEWWLTPAEHRQGPRLSRCVPAPALQFHALARKMCVLDDMAVARPRKSRIESLEPADEIRTLALSHRPPQLQALTAMDAQMYSASLRIARHGLLKPPP